MLRDFTTTTTLLFFFALCACVRVLCVRVCVSPCSLVRVCFWHQNLLHVLLRVFALCCGERTLCVSPCSPLFDECCSVIDQHIALANKRARLLVYSSDAAQQCVCMCV